MAIFVRNKKEFIFAAHTSKFGKVEHEALNIDIIMTDDITELIKVPGKEGISANIKLPILQQIVNTKLDKRDILTFNPSNYKHLPKEVLLFFDKLRMVIWNNSQDMQVTRFETYLHEFAVYMFYCAELEDGYNFTMVPCCLELNIADARFSAYADREGRRGTKTIWILDEDKHKFDTRYKNGIIQLVACLIAAAQRNRANHLSHIPPKMLGTLIKGDRMYICAANIKDEYLESLTSNIPDEDIRLEVIVYPTENNILSFSNTEQLKHVFICLEYIREYGLSITPSFDDL